MNAREAYWFWTDFSSICGSAVTRQRSVDGDDFGTDWDRQSQAMLTAGLSFACSMFETLGKKRDKPHNTVLCHLRNSLLHNSGNITKNIGAPGPENECIVYLAARPWQEFDPKDPNGKPLKNAQGEPVTVHKPYFTIDEQGQIVLRGSLFFFIERLFDSHLSKTERALGSPVVEK